MVWGAARASARGTLGRAGRRLKIAACSEGDRSAAPDERPLVLTVTPGAGFTFETACLVRELAGDCRLAYLKTAHGGELGRDGLAEGEWFAVPSFPPYASPSRLGALAVCGVTFLITARVLLTRPVRLVLVVGSPHAAPMLLAARLLGRRTVFVESITRVDQLSATGRVVKGLRLASRLFVQWPGLTAREPRSRLGTIL